MVPRGHQRRIHESISLYFGPGWQIMATDVQEYYDRNTKHFLSLGETAGTRAIHQPLYFSKNDSLREALVAPYRLILDYLGEDVHTVCDLGCGVGDGLAYLSSVETEPTRRFYGITLSEHQGAQAREFFIANSPVNPVEIATGDFLQLSRHYKDIDLAYAIESFIHAENLPQLFAELSKALAPGGRLIIFDDVRSNVKADQRGERILRDFKQGWKAKNLSDQAQYRQSANEAGLILERSENLTSFLDLWRPRDVMISAIAPFARLLKGQSAYATFLVGGNARQQAYKRGLLQYMLLVFQKAG